MDGMTSGAAEAALDWPAAIFATLKGYGVGASLMKTDVASLKAVIAKKSGSNPNPTVNDTDSDGTDKSARIWIMGTVSF